MAPHAAPPNSSSTKWTLPGTGSSPPDPSLAANLRSIGRSETTRSWCEPAQLAMPSGTPEVERESAARHREGPRGRRLAPRPDPHGRLVRLVAHPRRPGLPGALRAGRGPASVGAGAAQAQAPASTSPSSLGCWSQLARGAGRRRHPPQLGRGFGSCVDAPLDRARPIPVAGRNLEPALGMNPVGATHTPAHAIRLAESLVDWCT
jgi:hypothetical protein